MKDIKVAIVGVGNCAASLVQGVSYYSKPENAVPYNGLIHLDIGGYKPEHIKFVGAFEANGAKIGKDLGEAIYMRPNNMAIIGDPVGFLNAPVFGGPVFDSVGSRYREVVNIVETGEVPALQKLDMIKPDILINYLPVGSREATHWWASACLQRKIAFLNAIPAFIASEESWARRFEDEGVPLVGDDIKSQIGATIVHRVLTKLFAERGGRVNKAYQLNFGGNMDFYNMLNDERLGDKFVSKTRSIKAEMPYEHSNDDLHVSPSDHVKWMGDNKVAYIRMEGSGFGGTEVEIEMRLSVMDSPNSAGCVIDVVRLLALAQDRGQGGVLDVASSFYMKSPRVYKPDFEARRELDEWVASG